MWSGNGNGVCDTSNRKLLASMTEQQDRQTAAIKLQACARGYLTRKLYAEKLLERYGTGEAERGREREIPTASYRPQQETGEEIVVCENEQRKLNLMAIRIQRAWKTYQCSRKVARDAEMSIREQDRTECSHCELETETDHLSPDPLQGRPPDPLQGRSPDPLQGGPPDPLQGRSPDPLQGGSPDPLQGGPPGPLQGGPPGPLQDGSPDPLQGRSTSQCYSSSSEEVQPGNCHARVEERVGQLAKQVRLAFGESELEFSDEMSDHTETQLPKIGLRVTSMTEVILEEQTKLAETELRIARNLRCNDQESTSLNTERKTYTDNVKHNHERISVSPTCSGKSKPESAVSEDMYRLSYALELTDSSSEEEMDNTKSVSTFDGKSKLTIEPAVHTNTQKGESFLSLGNKFWDFEGGLHTTNSLTDLRLECKWQNDEKHKSRRSSENSWPRPLQSTVVDHRASPLYAMSLDQLRALLDSVGKRMKSISQSLIQLLEERELLTVENELLKANVARMTRKMQELHRR